MKEKRTQTPAKAGVVVVVEEEASKAAIRNRNRKTQNGNRYHKEAGFSPKPVYPKTGLQTGLQDFFYLEATNNFRVQDLF